MVKEFFLASSSMIDRNSAEIVEVSCLEWLHDNALSLTQLTIRIRTYLKEIIMKTLLEHLL